jgi:hypothetical protein
VRYSRSNHAGWIGPKTKIELLQKRHDELQARQEQFQRRHEQLMEELRAGVDRILAELSENSHQ